MITEVIPKLASLSNTEPMGAPPTPPPSSGFSSPPRCRSSIDEEIFLKCKKCTYQTSNEDLFSMHQIAADHAQKRKLPDEIPGMFSYFCLSSRSHHRTTNFPNSESRIFTTKFLF